jgi:uncharacterized protein YbaR (Trm112 family)
MGRPVQEACYGVQFQHCVIISRAAGAKDKVAKRLVCPECRNVYNIK